MAPLILLSPARVFLAYLLATNLPYDSCLHHCSQPVVMVVAVFSVVTQHGGFVPGPSFHRLVSLQRFVVDFVIMSAGIS